MPVRTQGSYEFDDSVDMVLILFGQDGFDLQGESRDFFFQRAQQRKCFQNVFKGPVNATDLIVQLPDSVEGEDDTDVKIRASLHDFTYARTNGLRKQAVRGKCETSYIIVSIKDGNDLGQVLSQERFPSGDEKPRKRRHASCDLFNLEKIHFTRRFGV